jgi:hypothetical protein
MPSPQLRIYVAGPYSASTLEQRRHNVDRAIDVGLQVWLKGHVPHIPHLTHFVDERASETGVAIGYEDYLEWDIEWLKMCDALIYVAPSAGADRELATATDLGLVIYYSVDQIPDRQRRSQCRRS